MAFRYMPDRDTIVIPECTTMSTNSKVGDKDHPFHASKIGLDCTIPMVGKWDPHDFDFSTACDLGDLPPNVKTMTEDELVTDMTAFIKQAFCSWPRYLQKYQGQPYNIIYSAFGRLRHQLPCE